MADAGVELHLHISKAPVEGFVPITRGARRYLMFDR
jgi:hypothetical protein